MGFNSAFKGLKLLKTPVTGVKQFKWPRPQCVKWLVWLFALHDLVVFAVHFVTTASIKIAPGGRGGLEWRCTSSPSQPKGQ